MTASTPHATNAGLCRDFNSAICWAIPIIIWSLLVGGSIWWNSASLHNSSETLALQRGRDLFKLIHLTRQWNAGHGGVYVVESSKAMPNPYLKHPFRDIESTDGTKLTMLNPAYMTRQISELAQTEGFHFHLTSDKPMRPENEADNWELAAINAFHQGAKEKISLLPKHDAGIAYRYMAPLHVLPECLACHAHQGYKVGDIRGGISIDIDARGILEQTEKQVSRMIVMHGITWLLVLGFMIQFLRSMRREFHHQASVAAAKSLALESSKKDLAQTKEQLKEAKERDDLTGLFNRHALDSQIGTLMAELKPDKGLLFISIDYFKDYNNYYGMIEGDILLRTISKTIEETFRKSGTSCGRYLSASFIVIETGISEGKLLAQAEALRKAVYDLKIPNQESASGRFVTVSIGVTHIPKGETLDARVVLNDLAQAVKQARTEGHNRVIERSHF